MSVDYGAAGAYGILLSSHQDKFPGAYEALLKEAARIEPGERSASELDEAVISKCLDGIVAGFRSAGIICPEGCFLVHTGEADERPGRTATGPDDWVIGFGIFTEPWAWPEIHTSFRELATFHTWVWAG